MTQSIDRWAINIDIEGFSVLWEKEDQVLWTLGELMRAIFRIGRECYPNSPDRLFAHQLGDGFVIVSDFNEESLERAITIGAAIMQHVANSGNLAKVAIAEGSLSDIQNCYPKEVLSELEGDHTVSLHMGLMTIFPVMGTALIRSFKLAKKSLSGPLLILEKSKSSRIPPHIQVQEIKDHDLLSIDWVHFNTPLLKQIQSRAKLSMPDKEHLEKFITKYCIEHPLPRDWINNTKKYLNITS